MLVLLLTAALLRLEANLRFLVSAYLLPLEDVFN